MRTFLRSRLELVVSETNLNYLGSITIPRSIMDKRDILEGEQIHVLNVNNGERFITYALPGATDGVCLNGAAARLGCPGDKIIVLTYEVR